jgi:hypothetical protein
MVEPDYVRAHKHSSEHRDEVTRSERVGCFYCLKIYAPGEIAEWVDEDEVGMGRCALCPRCGIDSVIGSASGYPGTILTEDASVLVFSQRVAFRLRWQAE